MANNQKLLVRQLIPYNKLPESALWADSLLVSHLANFLSVCLEIAEPMVMQAVKYSLPYLPQQLVIEAQKFIEQESNHCHFHYDWNKQLLNLGYVKINKIKKSFLNRFSRFLAAGSEKDLLVLSVAFEHTTCQIARYYLAYLQQHRDSIQPFMAYVIGYHAVEEIEHKAVCYDCCAACFKSSSDMHRAVRKLWPDYIDFVLQSMAHTVFYLVYRDSTLQQRNQLHIDNMNHFFASNEPELLLVIKFELNMILTEF